MARSMTALNGRADRLPTTPKDRHRPNPACNVDRPPAQSGRSLALQLPNATRANWTDSYAVRLAAKHDAHQIGVSIAPTGWQGNPADGFVAVAVREIVERHGLFERETAAEAIKNFEALAGRERVTFEFGHAHAAGNTAMSRLLATYARRLGGRSLHAR